MFKDKQFLKNLERATAAVRTWPEWKRDLLDPAIPEDWKKTREADTKMEIDHET